MQTAAEELHVSGSVSIVDSLVGSTLFFGVRCRNMGKTAVFPGGRGRNPLSSRRLIDMMGQVPGDSKKAFEYRRQTVAAIPSQPGPAELNELNSG